MAQLKSGVGAMRVPVHDLVSNWAYMVTPALAWNLKSWFALMMHFKADRRKCVAIGVQDVRSRNDPAAWRFQIIPITDSEGFRSVIPTDSDH